MLPILVNDRSRLTYHCSRAIITFAPGRNQKRSRSINGEERRGKGTRRSLLLESFQPFEHGIASIGSLLNFREMENWGEGDTKRNYENQLRFLAYDYDE